MLRIFGIILLVVVAGWVLTTSVLRFPKTTAFVSTSPAAVGFVAAGGPWEGTLTYGKDNMNRLVPYIVFKNDSGAVQTKALVFAESSKCDTAYGTFPCTLIEDALPTYIHDMPVTVKGTVEAEHILVTHMAATSSL